jgi:GT2 family glycosyltransferase
MYAEDMDFCSRALDRGLRVVHLPTAQATHRVGASSDSEVTRRTSGTSTIWIDNLEDFYVLQYGPNRLALYAWRATFAAGLATRAIAYRIYALLRRRDADLWRGQAANFGAFARRAVRRRKGRS